MRVGDLRSENQEDRRRSAIDRRKERGRRRSLDAGVGISDGSFSSVFSEGRDMERSSSDPSRAVSRPIIAGIWVAFFPVCQR